MLVNMTVETVKTYAHKPKREKKKETIRPIFRQFKQIGKSFESKHEKPTTKKHT